MKRACLDCGALSDQPRCPEHRDRERNGSSRRWRKIRERVLERDGRRCTERLGDGSRCPITTALEVHHVKPRIEGGSDDESNLTTLCAVHHLKRGCNTFGEA